MDRIADALIAIGMAVVSYLVPGLGSLDRVWAEPAPDVSVRRDAPAVVEGPPRSGHPVLAVCERVVGGTLRLVAELSEEAAGRPGAAPRSWIAQRVPARPMEASRTRVSRPFRPDRERRAPSAVARPNASRETLPTLVVRVESGSGRMIIVLEESAPAGSEPSRTDAAGRRPGAPLGWPSLLFWQVFGPKPH